MRPSERCEFDPCSKHGCCHCECPCQPDGDDNCEECESLFSLRDDEPAKADLE